jgi:hypothetical protein
MIGDIEDIRLGPILNNAMNGRYENADEIIRDIKLTAFTAGVRVIGEDEVDIGEEWEHVFELWGEKCISRHGIEYVNKTLLFRD